MLVILVLAAVPPMLFLSIAHEHHASQPEVSTQLSSVSRAALQGVESVRHGVENVQGIIGMLPRLWHREESQAEASATGHCVACHRLRLFVAISSELSEAGFHRRRMQRNTWIRWARNSSVSDVLEYRFFARQDAAAQAGAHEEDLVRLQLPSASSSRLPLWTLEMLQTAWALEHDFDFAFILHIADSGFLCIHRVTEELRYRPTERFVWAKYECDGNGKRSGDEDAAPKLVPGFLLLSRDVADFTHRAYARMRRGAASAGVVAPLPLQAFFLLLNLAILDDQQRIVQPATTVEYLNEWHQKSLSSSLRRTSTGAKPPAAHFCKRFVWGSDMVNNYWAPPNATTALPPPRLAGPSAAASRASGNLGKPGPAQLLPINRTHERRGATSANGNATARNGLAESSAASSSWWTMGLFSSTPHFGEAALPSRVCRLVVSPISLTDLFFVRPSQVGLDDVCSMTRMTLSLTPGTCEPPTASMAAAAHKTRSRDLHSIWRPPRSVRVSKPRYPPPTLVVARSLHIADSRQFAPLFPVRSSRQVPNSLRFRRVRTWMWFSRR